MKNMGIIAGIGPESTIVYYRSIIKQFQERLTTKDFPELTLQSINLKKMLDYVSSNNLEGLSHYLEQHIKTLENAGANYIAFASNTPHIVFDKLVQKIETPMISIVTETCKYISATKVKRVGLLGSKSTMNAGFYQKTGKAYGLEIIIPKEDDLDYIHHKYMNEIIFNNIIPKTKRRFIEITEDLKEKEHIEGIILGGTELPFILKQEDFTDLQVFDTTQIHVASIVRKMLEE
jgi:aspartate racemase